MSDDHFEIGAWIDFVRGISPRALHEQMQTHLASGCAPCGELAAFLEKVWVAGRQGEETVPEAWVKRADEIFDAETFGVIRFLPIRAATPAFDSLKEVQAGVRADARSIRHLTYEAEGCAVDVRLEPRGNTRVLSVVGQITPKGDLERGLSPVPIFVFRKNKIIARTSSNEFGEFEFSGLELPVSISFPFGGYRVDVPLDNPLQNEETSS